MPLDILCLSHLAWEETLFQRPQQVMTRLAAAGHRVLYCGCVGLRRSREIRGAPLITPHPDRLAVVHLTYHPIARKLEPARRMMAAGAVRRAATDFFGRESRGRRVAWIFHPGFVPLVRRLEPAPLVFDMMDRFPAFARPGGDTAAMERRAVTEADFVFAGGRSLHAACMEVAGVLGKPVACLPSGVDLAHFARALDAGVPVDAELAALRRPVLGYFGALDERVDFALLARVAEARPGWTIALVGPVIGEPEGIRPLPPNVVLAGPRPYDGLPGCLRAFDVCLIPFRTSRLVAHVSPTKTPEYLAGGKPVVSTAIPDVEADYGGVVSIVRNDGEFIAACEAHLAAPPLPADLAAAAGSRARSWDALAAEMAALVEGGLGG